MCCDASIVVTAHFAFCFTSCKSALNSPVVYSTDRSKAVVPVLVLVYVALWLILRGDLFYVLPCVILFLCFSVLLALRLPRLGKRERANLSAFRTFVRFALVCFCLFRLPLVVWERLRFMIVALRGLFSNLFYVPVPVSVQDYPPSLPSETIDPPVL